jgi:hypothetical protein
VCKGSRGPPGGHQPVAQDAACTPVMPLRKRTTHMLSSPTANPPCTHDQPQPYRVELAALPLDVVCCHPRLVLIPEALAGHCGVLALQLVHPLHPGVELELLAVDCKLLGQAGHPRRRRHDAADARAVLHGGPAAAWRAGRRWGPRGHQLAGETLGGRAGSHPVQGWVLAKATAACLVRRGARRRRRDGGGPRPATRPHLTTSARNLSGFSHCSGVG